ncbi:hypothetical protein Taro_029934 [Colocasia esculenta]|uniref:Uncharacterized protein n=1 Tax=Colocasia esculenta TaxID=4460 RepID=A0A843VYN2_COLES|nr:hypothetical protein [Colocasia esculenta]
MNQDDDYEKINDAYMSMEEQQRAGEGGAAKAREEPNRDLGRGVGALSRILEEESTPYRGSGRVVPRLVEGGAAKVGEAEELGSLSMEEQWRGEPPGISAEEHGGGAAEEVPSRGCRRSCRGELPFYAMVSI